MALEQSAGDRVSSAPRQAEGPDVSVRCQTAQEAPASPACYLERLTVIITVRVPSPPWITSQAHPSSRKSRELSVLELALREGENFD